VKDPETFIGQRAISVPDAVNRRRKAVVSSATRERLNYEIFYFADRASLERFRRDPVRYCGLLTNPADQMRFRPSKNSPRLTHAGRLYLFPDVASLRKFQSMPDSLAERKGA
jgi:YHS domain-containing protein